MMLLDKKISFEVLSVIENIENPIEGEDVLNLQKLYKNVNEYKINRNTK